MNLSDFLYFKINAFKTKCRAWKYAGFFGRTDIILGKNVLVKRIKGKHAFGKNIVILENSLFEVHDDKARIEMGDDCFLSYGIIVVCTNRISIGNNVWVGEYSSLRDATHDFSVERPMGILKDKSASARET